MVHIIQSLTVEASDYIHDVIENNRPVEGSWLRRFATGFNLRPLSLLYVKLVDIVESLLICVDATKNIDVASADDGGVSVSWLGLRPISPMDFIPVITEKTILENIIHSVVPIPTTKNKHGILKHDGGLAETVEGLDSFTLYFFPFVLFVFDAAFVHVAESLFAVVASVNEESTIPKNYSVIGPLAGHVTALKRADIEPLLLREIVVEQVLVEVATLFLVAAEKVQLVVVADTFCSRSRKRYFALVGQELPLIHVNVVDEKIVLPVVIIGTTEQIYLILHLYTVVPSPRREITAALNLYLFPLAYLHSHEILVCEAGFHFYVTARHRMGHQGSLDEVLSHDGIAILLRIHIIGAAWNLSIY